MRYAEGVTKPFDHTLDENPSAISSAARTTKVLAIIFVDDLLLK